MSQAATSGVGRRDGAFRRSRAGRTLVALLGVGSIALTTAAAHPLDPGARGLPVDLLAAGAAGAGSIGMLSLDAEPDEDVRTGSGRGRPETSASTRGGAGTGGRDLDLDLDLDLGLDLGLDAAVEVPVLGEETFASFIPAGLGDRTGIPAPTLRAYRAAAEVMAREAPGCGIDWALLAGIGRVEANHGRFGGATVSEQGVSVPRILGPRLDGTLAGTRVIRDSDGGTLDGDAGYDRAVGPMQFLPGTWARWGSDGDRDGASDPQDIDDAALAAARYLCEGRDGIEDPSQAALAVRRYNNSSSYVDLVLATADGYRTGDGRVTGRFTGAAPPPPGWRPPPGTVVGAGATGRPATPSPSPSPTPTQTTQTPTAAPTPTTPPSGPPTTSPTGSPSPTPTSTATGEPSASPTTAVPSPSEPGPGPSQPTPGCGPSPTAAPTVVPGGPGLAPCPVPCGTPVPSTTPTPSPSPTATPTCTPVPSSSPTP